MYAHIVTTAKSPRPSAPSAHALSRLVITLHSKKSVLVAKTNLTFCEINVYLAAIQCHLRQRAVYSRQQQFRRRRWH
jgi:hypothetical protein